jgi:hypothetical protein
LANALEPLIGRLVKVVYTDAEEVKVRRGRLLSADDSFIVIQTYAHSYAVSRAQVVELKTLEEGHP